MRGVKHDFPVDEARFWGHNRIVWAGPRETPAATLSLAAHLKAALEAHGFALEQRDFVAHVTLIRNASRPEELPPLPPVRWPVGEFVLARSRGPGEGPGYAIVERFPLS